jgi:hypothetical protein
MTWNSCLQTGFFMVGHQTATWTQITARYICGSFDLLSHSSRAAGSQQSKLGYRRLAERIGQCQAFVAGGSEIRIKRKVCCALQPGQDWRSGAVVLVHDGLEELCRAHVTRRVELSIAGRDRVTFTFR